MLMMIQSVWPWCLYIKFTCDDEEDATRLVVWLASWLALVLVVVVDRGIVWVGSLAGGLVGPWNAEEKKKNVGAQHIKKGRYTKNDEKRNG